jgi:hypothetical protein
MRACLIFLRDAAVYFSKARPTAMPPRADNHSAGAGELIITMPTTLSFGEVKKYQSLFITMAHLDVRAQGELHGTEQRQRLHDAMQRTVARWVAGDVHLLRIPGMPPIPTELLQLAPPNGSTLAQHIFNVLKCPTGTGRSMMNPHQMHARAGVIKTDMMQLIADWNMLCGCPAGHQSYGVPLPGTGSNKDKVYAQMVAVEWRVNETRRLLALLLSCRGVQFDNSGLCTDECIRRARESVYFAARGLTMIQERTCRSSSRADLRALFSEVMAETSAAEQIERDEAAAAAAAAAPGPTRAPPATGRGSRSSFTEQLQPSNYSLPLEHVFKVFGPYSPVVTPLFHDSWVLVCQSTYAVGRNTVAAITNAREAGRAALNPGVHPALRATPASASEGHGSTLQGIQLEAIRQNTILARREERLQLESLIANYALIPDHDPAVLIGYRRQHVAFCSTPVITIPASATAAAPAPLSSDPQLPESVTSTSDTRLAPARPRRSSPPRVVQPAVSLASQLAALGERFEFVECGGQGACTFKVLRVIEWGLGETRRALYGVAAEDSDTHTRSRIVDWMEQNEHTAIFSLASGNQTVGQAIAMECPDSTFAAYLQLMRQPHTCGGDVEIASFATMYVRCSACNFVL